MVNDYGNEFGGAETYFFNIVEQLTKLGHDVVILSSNAFPNKFEENHYSFSGFNKDKKLSSLEIFNFDSYQKSKRIINDFDPDIVHLHLIFYQTSPSILANLKDIPTVMTVHDYKIICPISTRLKRNKNTVCTDKFGRTCKRDCLFWRVYLYERVKRNIHKKLLKNIDLFISPSKFMKEMLEESFPKVVLLHHGVEIPSSAKIMIPKGNELLYIGRLSKEKGVKYLLMAMPKIIEVFPDVMLNVVGEGPEKDHLQTFSTKTGIYKNVKFWGGLPHEKISEIYKSNSITIIPSIWPENSPMVIYESMCYGRPVIGSDIGGIPDLVDNGRTGYLIPPENPDLLADKVIEILSKKNLLGYMSKNARRKAEKDFDMKNHIQKILKIYNNMC